MKKGNIVFCLLVFFASVGAAFGQAPRMGITVRLEANTGGCGGLSTTTTLKLGALNPAGTPSLSVSGTASGVPTNCTSAPFVVYQNTSLSFAPTQVGFTINGTATPYDFLFVKVNDIGEINGHTVYHYPTSMPVTQQIGNYTFSVNLNIPQIPRIGIYANEQRTVMTDRVCSGEFLYGDTPYKDNPIIGTDIQWETAHKQFNGDGSYYSDTWMSANNNTGIIKFFAGVAVDDTSSVFVSARLKLLTPSTNPPPSPGNPQPHWGFNDVPWKGPWSPRKKIIIYPQLPSINVTDIDSMSVLATEADLVEENSDHTFAIHHIKCNGGDNGKIIINSLQAKINKYFITVRNKNTGETMNYKLHWSPSLAHPLTLPDDAFLDIRNANAPFPFRAGSYEILVQYLNPDTNDPFGCVSQQNFKIKQPDILHGNISKGKYHNFDVSCYKDNTTGLPSTDGRIQVTPVGGVGPFDLILSGYAGINKIYYDSVRSPGSYQFAALAPLDGTTPVDYRVTFKDVSGCIATNLATLAPEFTKVYHASNITEGELLRLSIPDLISTLHTLNTYAGYNIQCFGATDDARVSVSGGTSKYSIWIDGNSLTNYQRDSLDDQHQKNFTGLTAGNYTIKVMDRNSCTDSVHITLKQPSKINIEHSEINHVLCAGANTGAILIQAKGGVPVSGQQYKYTLTLNNPPPVNTWPPGFDPTPPEKQGEEVLFSQLIKGSYTVAIADQFNCQQSYSLPVTEPDALSVVTSSTDIVCYGSTNGQAKVTVGGGTAPYTLQWLDSEGKNILAAIPLMRVGDFNVLDGQVAGQYYAKMTDANHCVLQKVAFISQPSAPLHIEAAANSVQNISCNGASDGKVALTITGGWNASPYEIGRSKINLKPNAFTYTALPAGVQHFYVRDYKGCIDSVDVTLHEPEILDASAIDIRTVNCFGDSNGSFVPKITGGTVPYEINMNASGWKSPDPITGLPAGNYSLQARDANGCISNFNVIISTPEVLSAKVLSSEDTRCGEPNGKATISVSGGNAPYAIAWSLDEQLISTAFTATALSSGVYEVKITDAKNCQTSLNVGISDSDAAVIAIDHVTPTTCFGYNDGAASIRVTGGILPYTEIAWANGQTGLEAIGLTASSQFVRVKDQKGCVSTKEVIVPGPNKLIANFKDVISPRCFSEHNGSMRVEASGGTAPYSYLWSSPISSNDHVEGLGAGMQTVIVTDAHACVLNASYNLTQPDAIVIPPFSEKLFCTGQTAKLDAGNPGATYEWSSTNGLTGTHQIFEATQTGTYTVTVTDPQNCTGTASFDLVFDSNILHADFIATSAAVAGDTVVLINISFPLPDSSYWTLPKNITSIESTYFAQYIVLPDSGTYTITLSATKGECFDQIQDSIIVSGRKTRTNDAGGRKASLITAFDVYPNPSSGKFQMSVQLGMTAPIDIKILSYTSGHSWAAYKDIGKEYYGINADIDVPPGVYAIVLQAGNEKMIKRIVIY